MEGPGDSPTKACELCCKEPGEDKPCLSSFELNSRPHDVPDMYSKPGTPCNDYQGYCDVFQKCREVDPLGPLLTLRRLLLSEKSIAMLKKFIVKYWYSVILAAIAVIALMVTIVKLCGKKTPLLHRRRRRRKTLYHENGSEFEPSAPNLYRLHIHPTAIKSIFALRVSNYK
jgi:disintegrin and metalloproteinase domain-containing protein 10